MCVLDELIDNSLLNFHGHYEWTPAQTLFIFTSTRVISYFSFSYRLYLLSSETDVMFTLMLHMVFY